MERWNVSRGAPIQYSPERKSGIHLSGRRKLSQLSRSKRTLIDPREIWCRGDGLSHRPGMLNATPPIDEPIKPSSSVETRNKTDISSAAHFDDGTAHGLKWKVTAIIGPYMCSVNSALLPR